MRPRVRGGLVGVALLAAGCSTTVPGSATPLAGTAAPGVLPTDTGGLGDLVLTDVPSGLPRVPDGDLDPPAGPKDAADIAGYADDPAREAQVFADYGYRWGWERFWQRGDRVTTVFIDQFDGVEGAGSYAADLARNDTAFYGGSPDRHPDDLPGGCSVLTVDDPAPDTGLAGPAAFAWCAHGPFTVSVAAVGEDAGAVLAEVQAVVVGQLDRLPRD